MITYSEKASESCTAEWYSCDIFLVFVWVVETNWGELGWGFKDKTFQLNKSESLMVVSQSEEN